MALTPSSSSSGGSGGRVLDYVTRTTTLAVTATTEGTAQSFIDGNAITLDGSTTVEVSVQFYVTIQFTTSLTVVPVLVDGLTVLGWFVELASPTATGAANQFAIPCRASRFLTPSAGSHTYHLKFFKTAGTVTVVCGPGSGSGSDMPAYMRVVTV